ncbi:flagellar basal body P-ring formation chaperone FlgA [Lichenicoccus sp.]|uniref:flagellar basal body P-ring formation chaperone FlgA n=1 Tax=Lichenicoccus sp. TaxID=2781899 RepID=UPI003D14BE3F
MSAGLALARAGEAAQPRLVVSLHSDTVRLSDLFSGLEPGQDCTIGPAPAAGQRIVVAQAQLVAIAVQFSVDWQPGFRPASVVVERKGRQVPREQLLPVIQAALVGLGAPADSEVALGAFVAPMVPAEFTGLPDVEQLTYDQSDGKFGAQLAFSTAGSEPVRIRITGVAQEMVQVPVLSHPMGAASIIEPQDLQTIRVRRSLVSDRLVLVASDAVGMALRHQMTGGSLIPHDALTRPLLVSRGMPVLLRLQSDGLTLTMQGQAIDGGALDDRIHILNGTSRAVLVAQVTGAGQARVDPGAAPAMLAATQAGLPPASSLPSLHGLSSQGPLASGPGGLDQ